MVHIIELGEAVNLNLRYLQGRPCVNRPLNWQSVNLGSVPDSATDLLCNIWQMSLSHFLCLYFPFYFCLRIQSCSEQGLYLFTCMKNSEQHDALFQVLLKYNGRRTGALWAGTLCLPCEAKLIKTLLLYMSNLHYREWNVYWKCLNRTCWSGPWVQKSLFNSIKKFRCNHPFSLYQKITVLPVLFQTIFDGIILAFLFSWGYNYCSFSLLSWWQIWGACMWIGGRIGDGIVCTTNCIYKELAKSYLSEWMKNQEVVFTHCSKSLFHSLLGPKLSKTFLLVMFPVIVLTVSLASLQLPFDVFSCFSNTDRHTTQAVNDLPATLAVSCSKKHVTLHGIVDVLFKLWSLFFSCYSQKEAFNSSLI